MNKSIEKLQQESRARIENFKREEEKKLKESIAQAKAEKDALWGRFVNVSGESINKSKREGFHVQFAPEVEDTEHPPQISASMKRLSFNLDELSIGSLRNINLENKGLKQAFTLDEHNVKGSISSLCIYTV